jgi:hypothetical protein
MSILVPPCMRLSWLARKYPRAANFLLLKAASHPSTHIRDPTSRCSCVAPTVNHPSRIVFYSYASPKMPHMPSTPLNAACQVSRMHIVQNVVHLSNPLPSLGNKEAWLALLSGPRLRQRWPNRLLQTVSEILNQSKQLTYLLTVVLSLVGRRSTRCRRRIRGSRRNPRPRWYLGAGWYRRTSWRHRRRPFWRRQSHD